MPACPLGVTVMPEWFACEGVDAVLDRVQAIGASAIATSPYVLERAPDGEGGREPPIDAGAGSVRPLDRPLFGRRELWVRTAPAFEHEIARYRDLAYQPTPPNELTARHARLLDRVLDAADRRGIEVLLQVMAASPPGYRVQFSSLRPGDECLGPEGTPLPDRVDRNGSLASVEIRAYTATLVSELAERYPTVAGFRLDWPEYPPYSFHSALLDFNPAVATLMRRRGRDADDAARDALEWTATVRAEVRNAMRDGAAAVLGVLSRGAFGALFVADGPLSTLLDAKRDAASGLVGAVRTALDGVPGRRRRLELQAFPPPFPRISGFPLDGLRGLADAVGVKLYTMHWPMIARFWARDLAGEAGDQAIDAVTAALAQAFGFVDEPTPGAALVYPEPDMPHPAGAQAQREKLERARVEAGDVPTIAFAHTYGPLADVLSRYRIAAGSGMPVWLNRYGYLSDAKLAALAEARR